MDSFKTLVNIYICGREGREVEKGGTVGGREGGREGER